MGWVSPKRSHSPGTLVGSMPRRTRLEAVIGHAIDFDTWRSLARTQGLEDGDAVELMVRLARAV